jgi:phage tail sheath protein FI
MAEKIVSPGVFTRENDLSFLSQGIGEIGAAIVGPFSKGPAFLPTIVNTQSEFEEIFGTPDGTYYTGYAVQNYLREAGTATIVRVGHIGGYEQVAPIAIAVSGSVAQGGRKIVATLHSTDAGNESVGFPDTVITSPVSASAFSISGSNLGVVISASVLPSAGNDIGDVFGESPFGAKNAYVYTYFEKTATDASVSLNSGSDVELIQLETQDFTGQDTTFASTPWVKSQLISGVRSDLFQFHTLGDGNPYNTEYKVSIFNVKAAGVSGATDYATFSVVVRGFSDTDRKKSVKETYNNVNLDPASPNYIAKIIGDRNLSIDANGKQTENGDYANRSKLIRVEVAAEGSFPIIAAPFGHGAYTNPIYVGNGLETLVPAVIYSTGSTSNTASSTYRYSGIDLETATTKINNLQYLKPIPSSATVGANVDFAFDSQLNYTLSTNDSAETIAQRQFTLAFQGGFDGVTPTRVVNKGADLSAGNSQGFNLTTSIASGSVAYVKAINAVSNPDDFDINLIAAPGIVRRHHSYVFDYISEMCENREDVFFIGDVTSQDDSIDLAVEQGASVDSNYVGTYYPWVKTIDRNTNKLTAGPPSVLMPGIYAANDAVAAEWFAPAGLNRGGIVGAVSVLNRLTHAERDTLYEGKINPIASFPGEGIVAFGQKTLQEKSSALDRINVRRLLIKVKKYIASTSRYLVFEQNTSTTRSRFLNTVNPYLEAIQQRQGLYAFRVVMDESNNTPDVIDRNILAGQIFLQPTKTAEFIVLDFNILPTGASFSA